MLTFSNEMRYCVGDENQIVKLRSRSRSGEGQEGQSQSKSSLENSKLKEVDLSSTLFLVFTTHHTLSLLLLIVRKMPLDWGF